MKISPVVISKEDLQGIISEVVNSLTSIPELGYLDEEELEEVINALTYSAWVGLVEKGEGR